MRKEALAAVRFAMNYSPQAAALLAEERIAVDLWKCPDWPDLIETARESRPIYVHFPLDAGTGSLTGVDWEQLSRLRDESATPYVNLHLLAKPEHFPEIPAESREPGHLTAVADRFLEDVHQVVERFGPERVIVENLIYRGPGSDKLYAAISPEVIGRVVRETGCGLLLDTAHARITSIHLGLDPREYIAQLPVEALRELHVTGVGHDGQRWRDHMEMTEPDFALAEWVAEQIRVGRFAAPWVMALEYGGVGPSFEWRSDARIMAEQVPRLYRLTRS
jgi:uncharacterized protein (UPF0276 family)